MNKINKLKKFLQENYPNAQAFNSRNLVGDKMIRVYKDDYITVDYALRYDYIEIFGLSEIEFDKLINKYGFLKTFRIKEDK